MQITGRRRKIAFFVILGICLVAAAVAPVAAVSAVAAEPESDLVSA